MNKPLSTLLFSLAWLIAASAESPNLLVNPDFAHGRTGWQDRTKPSQSISVVDDGPAGTKALRIAIQNDGGKNHGQLIQIRQDVKPNATYRLSAKIKTDIPEGAYLQVKLMKGKSEGTRLSTPAPKQTGEWVEVSRDIPTEADTTGIQVLLRYRMNASCVGKSVAFAALSLVGVSGGAETDTPPEPIRPPEAVKAVISAPGTDQYVTPEGAGRKDGSDWDNARPGTSAGITEAWAAAGPGCTVYLGPGTYRNVSLTLADGGESDLRRKTLRGSLDENRKPTTLFEGSWVRSKPANGPTLVTLRPGAFYVTLANLQVNNYKMTLTANGPNTGLRIHRIHVRNCRDAFWFDGGMVAGLPDSGTSDLVMQDCEVINHTKKGIRTLNGVHHSTFLRVRTDAGGKDFSQEQPLDVFSGGFHVLGSYRAKDGVSKPDHHIEFINCQADNNYHDPGPDKSYWNADGFASEGASHDISFIRCRAFNNTDGGWDIKSTRPLFRDCIGIGNKRNFRVWTRPNAEPSVFENCLSAESVNFGNRNHHVGFWLLGGGSATFTRCTSWNDDSCLSVEKGEKTHLLLENCLFIPRAGKSVYGRMDGEVSKREVNCVLDTERKEKLLNPRLLLEDPLDAFNCLSKPDIGYSLPMARGR